MLLNLTMHGHIPLYRKAVSDLVVCDFAIFSEYVINIAWTYISNVHNGHGCQTIMLNAHVRHELQFHSP